MKWLGIITPKDQSLKFKASVWNITISQTSRNCNSFFSLLMIRRRYLNALLHRPNQPSFVTNENNNNNTDLTYIFLLLPLEIVDLFVFISTVTAPRWSISFILDVPTTKLRMVIIIILRSDRPEIILAGASTTSF